MRMIVLAVLMLSCQVFAEEFIVGVDARPSLPVKVGIGLELTSSRCTEIVWRNYFPIPTKKTKVIRQTQTIQNDIAEFRFEFEKGLCNYAPTAILFSAEGKEKRGNVVVRPIQDGNTSDVEISLSDMDSAGLVYWRQFNETKNVPQVYFVLK